MSLGVLNNISALLAENNLNNTQNNLQTTLQQLSSGTTLNSGADNPAGLSLADGLGANSAALTQSATNASDGVGLLQVADGALSQVNSLLTSAVTLATEASNGTLNSVQDAAANQEYQSILSEITNIGSTTTFNSQAVFASSGNGTATQIFTGDSSSIGASIDSLTFSALSSSAVGTSGGTITLTAATATSAATISETGEVAGENLSTTSLTGSSSATTALSDLNIAISDVASQRGYLGSQINTLNSIANVENTEQENLTAAQNSISATNFGQATTALSQEQVLTQTGISALAQANSSENDILKLLQ
jgi:flagellin